MLPALIAAARVLAPTVLRTAGAEMAGGATAKQALSTGAQSISRAQLGQAAKAGYNAHQSSKAQSSSAPTSRERIPMSGTLPSGSYNG